MKNRNFTKFCGITTIKDALDAEKTGCNAIGFVFVKSSKRFIDYKACQQILSQLSPCTLTVALFANNTVADINKVLKECPVHVLQFHGSETAEFCNQFKKPYWKAVPMADKINPEEYAAQFPQAQAYLIDNFGTHKQGGSGHKFDWSKLPNVVDNKWILAGGLTPENIKQTKALSHMNCFDVSSGIEKSAGVKCIEKMKKFIEELND